MKEEKCIIQHACRISQQLTRTTDWRQRCPRPESAHRSYREDIDTFLRTHEASLIHTPLTLWIRFYVFAYMSVRHVCCHVPCEFFFVCLQDVRSVKWSVLIPSPAVPFLQPCKASKTKQRHHCLGTSLSKIKWEWPGRLFLIIFTRETHFWILKHLLSFNSYVVWAQKISLTTKYPI